MIPFLDPARIEPDCTFPLHEDTKEGVIRLPNRIGSLCALIIACARCGINRADDRGPVIILLRRKLSLCQLCYPFGAGCIGHQHAVTGPSLNSLEWRYGMRWRLIWGISSSARFCAATICAAVTDAAATQGAGPSVLTWASPLPQMTTHSVANSPPHQRGHRVFWILLKRKKHEAFFVTPDGKYVYVTNGNNTVAVMDTASKTIVKTIPVGTAPSGVAVTPDGKHV